MASARDVYQQLVQHLTQTSTLASVSAVLGWDEQTYMPHAGAEHRSNQAGLLAGMIHERVTDTCVGEWLQALADSELTTDTDSPEAANIRSARREFDRATKLPRRLVEELSRVTSLAQHAWVGARKASDFSKFLPWLEQIVTLKREEAAAVGYGNGVPYDALLDEFEPDATAAQVQGWFAPLRDELVTLIAQIRESGKQAPVDLLEREYPVEAQKAFGVAAAKRIGFSFEAGRLDEAAHPFCSGFGPGDVRLTTRYNARHFPGAFFGTLHEAGHGIYEQGLPTAAFGTACGQACSLGIHESQSRFWENFVGRGRPFWKHFYTTAQTFFPTALGDVPLDKFYWAINDVRPSFIRVEADEATYNLHILLRFEIEQPLMSGDLKPADVPAAWNEKFQQFFGMTPPNDAQGCLQDIHWSFGGIGYFPTYSLGNMYAAQFYATANREFHDLAGMLARGEFLPLKEWLTKKIHVHGKRYSAARLCEMVTGQPLSHEPLMAHLRRKLEPLYGI